MFTLEWLGMGMTELRTDAYRLDAGDDVQLTFAEPDTVRGGIVVLQEADGVTDGVRLLVASLASEGWLAVAPHISDAKAQGEQAGPEDVLAATDVSLAWLVKKGVQPDLLGVVGFDLGGTAALLVAARRRLGAAVSVGGQGGAELPRLLEIAGELTSPWLGMYGDNGDDLGIAEVEQLRDAASTSLVATNVVRYAGARHRFDANAEAAAEAWQRTLDWFDAHLR